MKKNCRRCEKNKPLQHFSISRGNTDGYSNTCKSCVSQRNKEYWRTPKGRISYIYNSQKRASKDRGHLPPDYTMNDLYLWALGKGLEQLVTSWKASGYKKNLAPSIDRLDDSKGYSFSNIQLVTWDQNNCKAYADRKSCKRITRQNRKVQQLTLDGDLIATFDSVAYASRATGVARPNIAPAANPNHPRQQAGGFRWQYV